MKVPYVFIMLTMLGGTCANAQQTNNLVGAWKPVEVWVDGKAENPQKSHFKLYVNEQKQWSLGDWPKHPELSDARIVNESFRPRGLPLGTLVLPEHFQIWSTMDEELGVMILSCLRSNRVDEQRTIKKYSLRGDKLFVLHVSSTSQPAKQWWGWAERHGDLGGGFFVGKCPSAGPKTIPEHDRASLIALKVPATPVETSDRALAKSVPKLESAGRPIVPRLPTEVVIYERVAAEDLKAGSTR